MEKRSEDSGDRLLGHCTEYGDDGLEESRGRQTQSLRSWLRANALLLLIFLLLLYVAILQTVELSSKLSKCTPSKHGEIGDEHFSMSTVE